MFALVSYALHWSQNGLSLEPGNKNLGWLPTFTLLKSRSESMDFIFSRKWGISIWENDDPLKLSFSFDLLSFQPRSSEVLSGDSFLHFSGSLEAPRVIFARSKPLPTQSGALATVIGQRKSKSVKVTVRVRVRAYFFIITCWLYVTAGDLIATRRSDSFSKWQRNCHLIKPKLQRTFQNGGSKLSYH